MKNKMAGICRFAVIYQSLGIQALWADYAQDIECVMPAAILPDSNGQEELVGQRKIERIFRNARLTSSFAIKINIKRENFHKG